MKAAQRSCRSSVILNCFWRNWFYDYQNQNVFSNSPPFWFEHVCWVFFAVSKCVWIYKQYILTLISHNSKTTLILCRSPLCHQKQLSLRHRLHKTSEVVLWYLAPECQHLILKVSCKIGPLLSIVFFRTYLRRSIGLKFRDFGGTVNTHWILLHVLQLLNNFSLTCWKSLYDMCKRNPTFILSPGPTVFLGGTRKMLLAHLYSPLILPIHHCWLYKQAKYLPETVSASEVINFLAVWFTTCGWSPPLSAMKLEPPADL